MKKVIALLLVVMLTMTLLTGCGGNAGSQTGTSMPVGQKTIAATTQNSTEPKGELKFAFGYSSKNNDAFPIPYWEPGENTSRIWDTLYRIDPETNQAYCLAAAELPRVSDDKLVWTIKLRKDITFHDGEKCTIDDVMFTINSSYAAGCPFFASFAAVTGYDQWTAKENKADTLSGMVKVDDYTMEIHLSKVDTTFIYTLCHGAFSILPKHLLKDVKPEKWTTYLDYWQKPIGTGPYRITEHEYGDYAVLTANERYFYQAKPTIKKFILNVYGDSAASQAAVVAGEIASLDCGSYAEAESLCKQNNNLKIQINESNYVRMLVPNSKGESKDGKTGPWIKNVKFRKAIDMIIDKKAIVAYLGGLASVATTFDFTGSLTYNKDIEPWKRDLEGGIALLKSIGFDFNYEVRLYTNYVDQTTIDILDIIVSNCKQAGVKMTYRCDKENAVDQIYKDKNYDFLYGANTATYDNFTRYEFLSPGSARDGWWGEETNQYRTDRYSKLVAQYKSTFNEEEKQNLRNQLSLNLYEDMFYMPLYFLSTCSVVNTTIISAWPKNPANLSLVCRTKPESYILAK